MNLNFSVTKKQKAFIDATEDEVLFGGAAGGGKSFGLRFTARNLHSSLFSSLEERRSGVCYLGRSGAAYPPLHHPLI